jgi:acetylornithine deacetylase/succinyl-diaminopimelate desuccinylase-like protein
MLDDVLSTIAGRDAQALAMLGEFLSIPSVSAQPDRADDCRRCAHWVADQLRFAMLETSVMVTGGHPVVVAKNKHVAGRPTVLLYGHYDVQPPEPLELWQSPPFEMTIRAVEKNAPPGTQAAYARGAVDDKGQVCCHLDAIFAWQAHGGLPVNLTVLIEGEEEIGSVHLERFVAAHKDALAADVCVISDTNQFARGYPAVTVGTRGLVYQEIIVTGPNRDLHSGLFGGAAANPANVLAMLLASLHDECGQINLPGFYDDVIELTPDERAAWRMLPFSEDDFRRDLGVDATLGERGFGTLEQTWARPTCDVNGITAGYGGPGAKTVIPAKASAKVSFRLVAGQDPVKVRDAFCQAMRERAPRGVTITFLDHGIAPAYLVPPGHPGLRAAAAALEAGFGKPATLVRSGGSIPIVTALRREMGVECLFVGFGLPDDNVHSPNEKFDLDCFNAGRRTAAVLYAELARGS